jgi:hypothetical protein
MFDLGDLTMLKHDLKLPVESSYESIIAGLCYAPRITRKHLIDKVSGATKTNFEILQKIIDKRHEESRKLRETE